MTECNIFIYTHHELCAQGMQKLNMAFYSEAMRPLISLSMYVILSYISTDACTELKPSNTGELSLILFLQKVILLCTYVFSANNFMILCICYRKCSVCVWACVLVLLNSFCRLQFMGCHHLTNCSLFSLDKIHFCVRTCTLSNLYVTPIILLHNVF